MGLKDTLTRRKKLFSSLEAYRSDSDNGKYPAVVAEILANQAAFDTFKRNRVYNRILEHVSDEQGQAYLDILRARDDGLLNRALERLLIEDDIGSPRKCSYLGVDGQLSPTTLRYVKVASDLHKLFGCDLGTVAEIGCGYGGQCLTNDTLLSVKEAVLFDLPFVNQLITRYLESFILSGAYRTTTLNQHVPKPFDLVISNYAFSELPEPVERAYITKVLAHAKRGYLTMNSGMGNDRTKGKMTLDQLREALPPFEILDEEPLTYEGNYIIAWGHQG